MAKAKAKPEPADPSKRTKRWYLRPEDHHGPNPAMVGAIQKRVAKGDTFPLHTTDRQHEQMIAEGFEVGREPKEDKAPEASQGAAAASRRPSTRKRAAKPKREAAPKASQVTRGTEEEVKGG